MSTRALRSGGVSRHAGNAAFAAATAAPTSASLQNGTSRTTSPLAGLVTLPERVLEARTARPFTHSGTVCTALISVGLFMAFLLMQIVHGVRTPQPRQSRALRVRSR